MSKGRSKGLARFLNQEVVLFLKTSRFMILDPESGQMSKGKEVPGFVLEIDDHYVYMSQDKETVFGCFSLDDIGAIVLNIQTIPEHLLEMHSGSTEDMN